MRIAGRPFGIVAIAPEVVRVVIAGWAMALLAGALLLLALHRWGWVLLMVVTGLGLLGSLWQWWTGNPEPIRLALLVVTAFYLNGHQVRDLFFRSVERAGAVPLAPQEGGRR